MELHTPVLLEESIEALNIRADGIYVDGTFGRGGHSKAILERVKDGRLIVIDRDEAAIRKAECLPVTAVRGNFRDIDLILDGIGVGYVDGILLDLGLSSPQLDEADRGFSYTKDAPLDMRMDRNQKVTAREIVNFSSRDELKRIFFEYGEERYAGRIASAIVRQREKSQVETTLELAEIIRSAMPPQALREKQHPAKRSFQAIRIAVNDELGAVAEGVEKSVSRLKPGGRLAVIAFHSLEDRIVKNIFKKVQNPCTCPPDFPVCVCGKKSEAIIITKKPIEPSVRETNENPRARSAKLRVVEHI